MRELDESFARLLDRQPTDAERQALYRVRDTLEIENNDALWVILMALQYHQSQYEKFPKAIAQAAQAILADFRVTADATAQASAQEAKAAMASAVAEISQKVAKSAAHTEKLKWVAGCVVVITLTFSGGFWYAFDSGKESGYGAGYKKAEDEKAAVAWANTPEGQMAQRFTQSGELQKLARCSAKGWKVEKRKQGDVCFPYAVPKGRLYGWFMP